MGNSNSNSNSTERDMLDLADAITLLRDQIAEAQDRIADPNGEGDQGIRFGLGEITLELGMELARTNGANGGLRFSVVNFGGKHEKTDKATHKVTVRLNPRNADGSGPVEVSHQR